MIEACRKLEAESGSSNRTFGVVMAAFFTLVLLWRYATGNGLHLGLALCAGIFLFLALLLPASLTLPNKAWTKLGLLMHSIVGPIALGVVFYLAITPTAFLMKLFGKPPLSLAYSNETSYWIKRTTPPLDMKKQF